MNNNINRKETPLIEENKLTKLFHIGKAFIKDESKNPFGTVKDLRNLYICNEANHLKVDKLVLITSGNNGYSLAKIAKGTRLKIVCVIDKLLHFSTKKLLREVAYDVVEVNLGSHIFHPEELTMIAREKDKEVIWDVTNGYEENYNRIADEIFGTLNPNYIVVPVGSGGIYLSLVKTIEKRGIPTTIIGIGVKKKINSVADKLSTPWTPYAKALLHYHSKGHRIYRLTEKEVREIYKNFKAVINCEPSSSVVFAAPQKHFFTRKDVVVFLNSGKAVS